MSSVIKCSLEFLKFCKSANVVDKTYKELIASKIHHVPNSQVYVGVCIRKRKKEKKHLTPLKRK